MSLDSTFEVTDLKQWTYCPRILFYRYCLPRIRPVTDAMRQGIEAHAEAAEREERRSLRTYGLSQGQRAFDVELRSEQLGLRGRIDLAIALPGRDAPQATGTVVEYKDSERSAGAHFKLQLAAYAMLLEEAWHMPVRQGYIYHIPTRSVEKIAITAAQRHRVEVTVAHMRGAIDGERMPDPPASRAPCVGCEFRRFCNDVV
jgi:CRISPR-associated exonuclease Cas4